MEGPDDGAYRGHNAQGDDAAAPFTFSLFLLLAHSSSSWDAATHFQDVSSFLSFLSGNTLADTSRSISPIKPVLICKVYSMVTFTIRNN